MSPVVDGWSVAGDPGVTHWGWMVLESRNRLHFVPDHPNQGGRPWGDEEENWLEAVAVCGAQGRFEVPGVLSRFALARCLRCCRKLGIPAGRGTPANERAETLRAGRPAKTRTAV